MIDDIIEDLKDKGTKTLTTEIVKGSGREVTSHQIRTSRAKLNLKGALQDASMEISYAIELVGNGWGYALVGMKKPNLFGVRGGEMSEEVIDANRKKIGLFHEWEFHTEPKYVMSVKAIEEFGLTANEYGRRIDRSPSSILDWYRKGLNEYCIMRGWGEQL